jgi:hypothetical protein
MLCLVLAMTLTVRANTSSVQPSQDTVIWNNDPSNCGGTGWDLCIFPYSQVLVKFDLSAYTGRAVQSDGTANLFFSSVWATGSVNVYLATQTWNETSTYASIVEPCYDTASTPIATFTPIEMGGNIPSPTPTAVTIPKSVLQNWIDNPSSNQGVVFVTETAYCSIRSRECIDTQGNFPNGEAQIPTLTFDSIVVETDDISAVPSQDTSIQLVSPYGSSGYVWDMIISSETYNLRHVLMKFDLSAYPEREVCDNGTLNLYFASVWLSGTVNIYVATQPWDESSTYSSITRPYYNSSAPIVSFTPVVMGGDVVSPTATVVTIPKSVIQNWIDNPSSNYGLVMKTSSGAFSIRSRECIDTDGNFENGMYQIPNLSFKTAAAAQAPVFSVGTGVISGPTQVTITSATSGATIAYTTDGSVPTKTNGAQIASGGSITVSPGTTLRACAWAVGYPQSLPAKAIYRASSPLIIGGDKVLPLGWYLYPALGGHIPLQMAPLDESQTHNFDFVMPYAAFTDGGDSGVLSYLDSAQARGVKILVDLQNTYSLAEIQRKVALVKNHPALYGYYLADEPDLVATLHPTLSSAMPATLIAKYNAIKEIDYDPAHPVVITFLGPISSVSAYLPAADIVARELYSTGVISQVAADVAAAKAAGKGFLAIPGVYQDSGHTMPSTDEVRFGILGSLASGADGILIYIFEGYEGSGTTEVPGYRDSIVYPTTDLLVSLLPQLVKGQNGLSVTSQYAVYSLLGLSNNVVWTIVGDANKAVLIAANLRSQATVWNVDFTLAGLDSSIITGVVVGENRTVTLNSSRKFTDSFSAYQVHVYQFTKATANGDVNGDYKVDATDIDTLFSAVHAGSTSSVYDLDAGGAVNTADIDYLVGTILGTAYGDANLDKVVDVGDLGILAANYGKTTGATWSQGDFNGDGAVDVGDLGILAANYGTGSSSGSSFEADYAKVFGTTTDDGMNDSAKSDDSITDSSSICSGLGLPLILGFGMIGLSFVKYEESNDSFHQELK